MYSISDGKEFPETFYYCKPCGYVDLTVVKQIGYLKICVCQSCGRITGYYDSMREFLNRKNENTKKM